MLTNKDIDRGIEYCNNNLHRYIKMLGDIIPMLEAMKEKEEKSQKTNKCYRCGRPIFASADWCDVCANKTKEPEENCSCGVIQSCDKCRPKMPEEKYIKETCGKCMELKENCKCEPEEKEDEDIYVKMEPKSTRKIIMINPEKHKAIREVYDRAKDLIDFIKRKHPEDFIEGATGFNCPYMKALERAIKQYCEKD